MAGKFSKKPSDSSTGHREHVGDRLAAVVDLERLGVVPLAVAHLARDVDVGQEVHLDALRPAALARLAAAALDVEAEPPGLVAADLGLAGLGEDLPHLVEHAGVGGRVAPGRPADGALVDLDDLVDLVAAVEGLVDAGLHLRAVELALEGGQERLVDQRALAGAGTPVTQTNPPRGSRRRRSSGCSRGSP
jgi:hypothetical protein